MPCRAGKENLARATEICEIPYHAARITLPSGGHVRARALWRAHRAGRMMGCMTRSAGREGVPQAHWLSVLAEL